MVAEKYERYEITNIPEGLQVFHWEALPSLGFGVVVLVILTACFLTDPYQGHNRIWAGLGVVALALVALFGVKVETWIISDRAIRYKSGVWRKERLFELSSGMALTARVKVVPCEADGAQPTFPRVVHLFGPGEIEVGDGLRFRERSTMLRFLETLHNAVPIVVTDVRPAKEDVYERGNPPAVKVDRGAE